MKKFLSGVLVGALLTISGTALAANIEKIEAYFRPDFQVSVNGQVQDLKNAPVTVNGSMYLPLRELGNVLGYNVNWNEQTKTADLTEAAVPTETPNNITGGADMEFEIIEGYYNIDGYNEEAIKVGNTIYIPSGVALIKYKALLRYDLTTDSFTIADTGQVIPIEKSISEQVDAFYYGGRAYIKESIFEQLQPAN